MSFPYDIKIIIADDHQLYRDGFATLFRNTSQVHIVAEASNGEQLVSLVRVHQPDVVMTDVRMPVMNGVQATTIIRGEFPSIPVIALTMYSDEGTIIAMLKAGVTGYINKDAKKEEIAEAIKTVLQGRVYYCAETTSKINCLIASGQFDPKKRVVLEKFSPTEKRLIHYVCEEMTSREIAGLMRYTKRAVDSMRRRIMVKMEVRNQAGMIIFALKNGLYNP